jgi:hypothetical protein
VIAFVPALATVSVQEVAGRVIVHVSPEPSLTVIVPVGAPAPGALGATDAGT